MHFAVDLTHSFARTVWIVQASAVPLVMAREAESDPLEQIAKLKKLLDMGAISHTEFEAKKAELIAKV